MGLFPWLQKTSFLKQANDIQAKSLRELTGAYKHKGFVLYIGAGVSRSIGLPSWADLVRNLTFRLMTKRVDSAISVLGKVKDESRWDIIDGLYDEPFLDKPSDKPILISSKKFI